MLAEEISTKWPIHTYTAVNNLIHLILMANFNQRSPLSNPL